MKLKKALKVAKKHFKSGYICVGSELEDIVWFRSKPSYDKDMDFWYVNDEKYEDGTLAEDWTIHLGFYSGKKAIKKTLRKV